MPIRTEILCCTATLLLATPAPLTAQAPDLPGATRLLIRPAGQQWVFRETLVFRGDQACTQGESWRFRPHGRLEVTRCIDARFVKSVHRWSIRSVSPIDLELEIEGDRARYPFVGTRRLLFRDAGRVLVLRRMPDSKAEPFEDLTLRRSD